MGTRGLIGIRNNKELLKGFYNHYDSYYSGLGGEVIEKYFKGDDILEVLDEEKKERENKEFLQDGLFCEYAYIWNKENDTLEIYRGFFRVKQSFNIKEQILNNLEDDKDENGREKYYCHLIIIVDKKKHTKEDVLKAFNHYDKSRDDEDEENEEKDYPERDIIPLEVNKDYVLLV